MLQARQLTRHFRRGPTVVKALDGVDLDIERGELVALLGASGSGKSTLLSILAGLDTPTGGRVCIDGADLYALAPRALARYRARHMGMVFQGFHLMPHNTAVENVELALTLAGVPRRERRPRARAALEEVGLGDRLDHRPADLSGGEQQRVALARALVKEPALVLADEPTGNLDRDNSAVIAGWLQRLHRRGLTIVLATHDLDLAARLATRTVRLDYGRIAGPTAAAGGERSP